MASATFWPGKARSALFNHVPGIDALITPDGRYLIVRGRLWRTANPDLAEQERTRLVHELMEQRRAIRHAMSAQDEPAERKARDQLDVLKQQLGERGPVWWTDGAPDLNRKMARNTPYADWYASLGRDQ